MIVLFIVTFLIMMSRSVWSLYAWCTSHTHKYTQVHTHIHIYTIHKHSHIYVCVYVVSSIYAWWYSDTVIVLINETQCFTAYILQTILISWWLKFMKFRYDAIHVHLLFAYQWIACENIFLFQFYLMLLALLVLEVFVTMKIRSPVEVHIQSHDHEWQSHLGMTVTPMSDNHTLEVTVTLMGARSRVV